ncbi:MAG: hypothetical protein KAI44_01210 [Methylococcales bacterium]|nr:hypothetical protein [Methylococcales bacterium]
MKNTQVLLDSYQYLANHYKEQYHQATETKIKQEYKRRLIKVQQDISTLKKEG